MHFFFILFLIPSFSFSRSPETLFIKGQNSKEILIEFNAKEFEVKGDFEEKSKYKSRVFTVHDEAHIKTSSKNIYLTFNQVSKVHIKNFQDVRINLSIKEASVFIENSKGFFSISLDKGKLEMNKNSGQLRAQTYAVETKIDHFEGKAYVLSYKNPILIKNIKGDLELNTFKNPIELVNAEGSLKYHNNRSNVRLRSYKGSIDGVSQGGNIRGSLKPKKIQIESQSGDINLYFQNAKARVEAQSWEGKIYSPKTFYKDRSGGVSQSSGFITGRGDSAGIVSLKSRSGNIYIQ